MNHIDNKNSHVKNSFQRRVLIFDIASDKNFSVSYDKEVLIKLKNRLHY